MDPITARRITEQQLETIEQNPELRRDPALRDSLTELVQTLWEDALDEEKVRISTILQRVFKCATAVLIDRPSFDTLVPDGWFRKYLDYCAPAQSTSQFFFGAALGLIGSGLGRRPMLNWSVQPLHPNMYILLVGGTGSGKGTAIGIATSIIAPVIGPNMMGNEGTPQGYAARLQRRFEETGMASDGLIIAEELRVLLSHDKNKADLITWLTQWYTWNEPIWSRELKGEGTVELRNVCVSLLGGSNMTWLKKVPEDAIYGGFFPRFVIFDTPLEEEKWGKGSPLFNAEAKCVLQDGLGHLSPLGQYVQDTMEIPEDARRWLDDWYENDHFQRTRLATDDLLLAAMKRKQSHMMKVAMIWQLVDRGPADALQVKWLRLAKGVLDWTDHTLRSMYQQLGVTQEGEATIEVFDQVKKLGGSAVPENRIVRSLRNKYGAKRIRGALEDLAATGDLRRSTRAGVGKVYYIP